MEYSVIERTGLRVSRLALGTVELGMDYGFQGTEHRSKPAAAEAIRIVQRALDLGINLIDTAPTYGNSEELIGKALAGMKEKPLLASKVTIPDQALAPEERKKIRRIILTTIETSLSALGVEKIDILQIHNTTQKLLTNDDVLRALEDARTQGKVGFLGASCVGEEISLAALQTGHFDALQLPFNMLDRQMVARVFKQARHAGVGILSRSAFLRGILTSHLAIVPDSLAPLKEAARRLSAICEEEVRNLSEMAIRFCLSYENVSSVIIGVRTLSELEMNVADIERGNLSSSCMRKVLDVSVADSSLVNPATWYGMI